MAKPVGRPRTGNGTAGRRVSVQLDGELTTMLGDLKGWLVEEWAAADILRRALRALHAATRKERR